uniref:YitT family protein n=1 Tax=candidate division WOR-3 bacterium TaxID=2052148 RepID=A0A7C4YH40_UNCW3
MRNYFFIIFGSLLSALGFELFLVPLKITPGGVGSIAIVIYNLFHFPFGITYAILNIPIFLMGIKNLGFRFGFLTILSIILISVFSLAIKYIFKPKLLTSDLLLASLYGAVLLGAGIGFVFKGGGSTGGTDILGRLMNKYTGITTGLSIFIIDSFIICLSGFTFQSFDLILFSFIALFVSSKIIDTILEGSDYARSVMITTKDGEKISNIIMEKLNRGATLIKGIGMYTGEARDIVITVISIREVEILRYLVKQIDPDAFVVIYNVHEVLGKGFKSRY